MPCRRHRRRRARPSTLAVTLVVAALTPLAGCGDGGASDPSATERSAAQRTALVRADAIVAAVGDWARASTLADAQAAAARARGLITGPEVGAFPASASAAPAPAGVGLLPSDDGTAGLASALARGCVERDVLGGGWTQPRARWRALAVRIEAWHPDDNTFPQLPSHAQRVVGWATLALGAESLAEAGEYSGHAAVHARVVRDALRDPGAEPCPG